MLSAHLPHICGPRGRSALYRHRAPRRQRSHQGIAQQIPESRLSPVPTATTGNVVIFPTSSAAPVQRTSGKVIAFPVLNGLHHTHGWATWRFYLRMKRVARTGSIQAAEANANQRHYVNICVGISRA